jgi:hypothetical protein
MFWSLGVTVAGKLAVQSTRLSLPSLIYFKIDQSKASLIRLILALISLSARPFSVLHDHQGVEYGGEFGE